MKIARMEPIDKPVPRVASPPIAMEGEKVAALDCDLFLGPDGPLPMTGVTQLTFADLSPERLAALDPGLIILPLFTASHDAMTVIERLEELGYAGRLTVLAPQLPRPRLVERELRSLGPGTRLTLISP